MPGILHNQPDVILFCKADSLCDMVRLGGVDGIYRGISQIARRSLRYSSSSSSSPGYRRTSIGQRIGIPDRLALSKDRIRPLLADMLAEAGVVVWAGIAWFGNGVVVDQLAVDRGVEAGPFGGGWPAGAFGGLLTISFWITRLWLG